MLVVPANLDLYRRGLPINKILAQLTMANVRSISPNIKFMNVVNEDIGVIGDKRFMLTNEYEAVFVVIVTRQLRTRRQEDCQEQEWLCAPRHL